MSVKSYITKTGKTKYYTSFRYTDWTGHRKQVKKEGFDKKKDAIQYERNYISKKSPTCNIRFDLLVELYQDDNESRVRNGTKKTRDSIIETWILPYFKDLIVNKIDAIKIRNWQNECLKKINPRSGKPYADTYLRSMNSRLSAIFNFAVKFLNLSVNPCSLVDPIGKKRAAEMKFWTLEQFEKAMKHVGKKAFRVAYDTLFWLGLREGECLSLMPKDILSTRQAHIDKTYHREDGEDTFGPPKSDNGFRDVSIPEFLYCEIKQYISALYGIESHDRIFYMGKGTLGDELKRIARAADLPEIRLHDLRHSHVALLIELGYSPTAIAERIGDTVDEVNRTYSHLYPQKKDRVAQNLNRVKKTGIPSAQQEEKNDLWNLTHELEIIEATA